MNPLADDLRSVLALLERATPDWRQDRFGVIRAGEFRRYPNGSAQSQIASFTSDSDEAESQRDVDCSAALAAVTFLRTHADRLTALLAEHGGEAVAWTDEQCLEFASVAFRHAPKNLPPGVTLQDIRMGAARVTNTTPPPQARGDMVLDVIWRIDNEAEQFIPAEGMKYLRYLRDLLAAAPGEGSGESASDDTNEQLRDAMMYGWRLARSGVYAKDARTLAFRLYPVSTTPPPASQSAIDDPMTDDEAIGLIAELVELALTVSKVCTPEQQKALTPTLIRAAVMLPYLTDRLHVESYAAPTPEQRG